MEAVITKKKRGRPRKQVKDLAVSTLASKQKRRETLLKFIEDKKVEKLDSLREEKLYKSTHLWEYFERFRWQDNISSVLRRKMIVLAPMPNGTGKTTELVCSLASWAAGYEAWNEVDADYPGAVCPNRPGHLKQWYKPSSLGIKPPVRLRLTGEDWNHHLGQVVVPEMKKWFPMEDWDTKKNTSGVDYFWTHKPTGSTIELMTHDQDLKLFEAWRGHGWGADEPPKYGIFKAMSRGLAENRGKMFFPSTPLKEAWMLDELILKNRSDVGVIKDLTLLDNEISFSNDVKILDELGIPGKVTKYWRESDGQKKHFFELLLYVDDLGVKAEKYLKENIAENIQDADSKIMSLIFLKRAKDTSLDEKPSRFFGLFKRLVGLVIKNFEKDKHIVPAPKDGVPVDWVITPMIDLHLNKPHAISFFGCDRHNRHFLIYEVWENMTTEEIADLIIRKKRAECWNISNAYIDNLSKGDDKYVKNRGLEIEDSFSIIERRLAEEDILLHGASKDKESGFLAIRTWLEGPNKIPIVYFFDTLHSVANDGYGTIHEIQRLCFDDQGKPEKFNDHFMENFYRYTQTGVEYEEDVVEDLVEVGGSSREGWLAA